MKHIGKLIPQLTVCCIFALFVTSCRKEANHMTEFRGEMISLKGLESVPELPRKKGALQTIDLTNAFDNPGVLDFGHNVKDYHFIILETNKNCVIGEINKVTIIDSLVFVLDTRVSNELFMFRYDGSFVRCIGSKGKGPGEYIQATDFYVDETKGIVTLYDQFKASLLDYSINDGQYINTRKIPFRLSQFTKLGEHYIYEANTSENDHISSISNRAMLVGSDQKAIEYTSLLRNGILFRANKLRKIDNTTASISIPFVDTIYYTDGTSILPKYYIKFNSKTRLPDNYKDLSDSDYDAFNKLFPQSKYTLFNGEYTETCSHIFFRIYYSSDFYFFYYNKTTHQLISGTPNKYPDPEPVSSMSFFAGISPISNYGDMFIGIKNPQTIFSALLNKRNITNYPAVQDKYSEAYAIHEKRYPQLKDVEYDDNPVLVLFSLR